MGIQRSTFLIDEEGLISLLAKSKKYLVHEEVLKVGKCNLIFFVMFLLMHYL